MSKSKPKFYVVWRGRTPGIYSNWTEASEQVTAYPNAQFKSFSSRAEAEAAFRGAYTQYAGNDAKTARKTVKKTLQELQAMGVVLDSLAVDAACSGNPGRMEYRGVYVKTGEQMFLDGPYEDATNNVGEFLAIVRGMSALKEAGKPDMPIYSDSYNARQWVQAKVCRTNLLRTPSNVSVFDAIDDALEWLKAHPITNPILVWNTEQWGEIPADFGRK
jgi:ribonuclease HI